MHIYKYYKNNYHFLTELFKFKSTLFISFLFSILFIFVFQKRIPSRFRSDKNCDVNHRLPETLCVVVPLTRYFSIKWKIKEKSWITPGSDLNDFESRTRMLKYDSFIFTLTVAIFICLCVGCSPDKHINHGE